MNFNHLNFENTVNYRSYSAELSLSSSVQEYASSSELLSLYDYRHLTTLFEQPEALLNSIRESFGLPNLGDDLFTNVDNVVLWEGHELGQGITLTYTYDLDYWIGAVENFFPELAGFDYSVLSDTQKTMVEQGLAVWSNIANINFVLVEGSDVDPFAGQVFVDPILGTPSVLPTSEQLPDIVIRSVSGDTPFSGAVNLLDTPAYLNAPPAEFIPPGYINGGEVRAGLADMVLNFGGDTFSFRTIVHEIGHALTLKHTFPNPGEELFGPYLDPALQNIGGSIMDTRGLLTVDIVDGVEVTNMTPMILDIITIQALYGQNLNYHSGNNTYTFNGIAANTIGVHDGMTIWDGNGNDTINSSAYSGDVRLDLREGLEYFSHIGDQIIFSAAPFSFTLENGQVLSGRGANIENATAGAGNDTIFGNDLNNILNGGNGNDTILGGKGNDSLVGGSGNDILEGGRGSDNLNGGGGIDTISYMNASSGVIVNIANGKAIGGDGTDFFSSIENVTGSQFTDTLNGNSNANTLNGLAGADIMNGLGGNDVLFGGDNNDIIIGGDGGDRLDGGSGNDALLGGNGQDILSGGEGNDALLGGGGQDVFVFDIYGLDTLLEGNDSIIDLDKNDVLQFNDINDMGLTVADLDAGATFTHILGSTIVDFTNGGSLTLAFENINSFAQLNVVIA